MSFKQMPTITTTIRAPVYNDTTYCMTSLVRNNDFEFCRNIKNTDLDERVTQILWQVNNGKY
jgi:hypothetical protein